VERDKSGLAAPVVEERRGSGSIGEAKEGGAKDPATGGKLEFVVKTRELGGEVVPPSRTTIYVYL
jgi:hypothetical protein